MFTKINISNGNQYGFKRNRSTTIALFHSSQKVSTFMNNKPSVLDIHEAFDTMVHRILLGKADYMGAKMNTNRSYLQSILQKRQEGNAHSV